MNANAPIHWPDAGRQDAFDAWLAPLCDRHSRNDKPCFSRIRPLYRALAFAQTRCSRRVLLVVAVRRSHTQPVPVGPALGTLTEILNGHRAADHTLPAEVSP